jgi:UDP-3-O-[3-hydroxymyristoyl] N-acetylglucosamine deacetylase
LLQQRTLRRRTTGEGIALHSGAITRFHLLPAPPDTGIVFVRIDGPVPVEIPARPDQVVETRLATTLGRAGTTISTVEHLLAALAGLGVDNARIEVDGPEVPIMDGSAEPFVDLILSAGITSQSRPRRFLAIRRPVEVTDGGRTARLEPAPSFQIDCRIDFAHPLINRQRLVIEVTERIFKKQLSRARTFGFAKDVAAMQAAGLALGGRLDNAVVIDDFSIWNPEGLRFPDEFVRHKALDAIGDLALFGAPLLGRYVGDKSGHALNTQLVAAVLSQPRAFGFVEFHSPREIRGMPVAAPSLG